MQSTTEKQTPPISVRVTASARALLSSRAGDIGLSAYVRRELFGDGQRRRSPRSPQVQTRDVAHVLALLGQSELATSLQTLAHAARIGALPVLPETEKEISEACRAVEEMRSALLVAHQVRGFIRNNVLDALREAYAVSRGTRCKQFLFSLSLSPPSDEKVPAAAFEKAVDMIEMRLGLVGQPRVIVFHEKDGRRHAHCVWSRIDAKTMTARQMGHFKLKLTELSRELYLEHGWRMPKGLAKTMPQNPLNFTLEEWQQAKRIGRDPSLIKTIFKDCWAMSDSGTAFQRSLEMRGYYLAVGDRRGFVAVDWHGEIYSISRWCGVPTKLIGLATSNLSRSIRLGTRSLLGSMKG